MNNEVNDFFLAKEIWHSITHGVGFFLGIAALVLLVVFASLESDATGITSVAIYGATLVIIYGSSTLSTTPPPIPISNTSFKSSITVPSTSSSPVPIGLSCWSS